MTPDEHVILVDDKGREIGTAEKLHAHQTGKLHRAFSVFIYYQNKGVTELLLQQRHPNKYHSGGLWTNTCCSHPRPGETVIAAAKRRLQEEMGIEADLQLVGEFQYHAKVGQELIEHEYDYVLIGFVQSKEMHIDPNEIIATRWVALDTLKKDLSQNPTIFTAWFKQACEIAEKKLQ